MSFVLAHGEEKVELTGELLFLNKVEKKQISEFLGNWNFHKSVVTNERESITK